MGCGGFSTGVKDGSGSEGGLPGACCPEHACKLSRKDSVGLGGGPHNKEGTASEVLSIFSETRHSL